MKMIKNIVKEHFESLDSTNTRAAIRVSDIEEGMLLLTTADEQTSGRGRFGHHWLSPKKLNFYGTFGFLFNSQRTDIGNLPQVLALSALQALKKLELSAQLKWPNDLLVKEKKIGGILTEAKATNRTGYVYMLLGIGININMSLEFLENLGRPGTSLLLELGKTHDIEVIREMLLQIFMEDLNLFIQCGFPPFLELYKKNLSHQCDDIICFHTAGKRLEGRFVEISDHGSLKLCLPNGIITEFTSGEIF